MEQIEQIQIPFLMGIPFVLMLACLALMPLFVLNFWESNKNKLIISLVLGVPTTIWMLVNGFSEDVIHMMFFDYVPFIILLAGLFIITGGIFIDADIQATPKNNTLVLLTGTVLASFIGTTGAAMLLIRLLLQMNQRRQFKVHTFLFFIACVANCGGLLTPLGDPPLFMMYLRGADFFWFFTLVKPWLFVNGILLTIYFIYDNHHWKRETQELRECKTSKPSIMKLRGKINFLWLAVVICAVAFLNPNMMPFMKENALYCFIRDVVIIFAAIMSLVTTKKECRKANHFEWYPILEVAYIFIGIFLTMAPVLRLIQENAYRINISTPTEFYFITGTLSLWLDNTPTAITFYSLAEVLFAGSTDTNIVAGIPAMIMKAICLGAVLFGSMTYIANGPNFMVKSIAEHEGIKMPQFFQYMFRFSLIIILPVLIVYGLLFF